MILFLLFHYGFSINHLKLTSSEIQVANLVKQGKSTKDIADLLNMSLRTIDAHRYNIRKKLGISNTKTSLARHLSSFNNTNVF
jgi:DNA-binding CsgD family transcriptional regulator